MSVEYFNARSAAHRVASFFLRCDSLETERLDIGKIRELRDSITIIDHYLWRRREQETNRLLNGFGDKCQIRHGHVGDYVSNTNSGKDYELPAGQTDGQLVEVDSDGAKSKASGTPSSPPDTSSSRKQSTCVWSTVVKQSHSPLGSYVRHATIYTIPL